MLKQIIQSFLKERFGIFVLEDISKDNLDYIKFKLSKDFILTSRINKEIISIIKENQKEINQLQTNLSCFMSQIILKKGEILFIKIKRK